MALLHDKSLRDRTRTGWLESYHTFSFGGFHAPDRMGHRALRVINEDVVIPGAGFGEHGHEAMDILTYVISGALKHGDSMGNTSIINAGDGLQFEATEFCEFTAKSDAEIMLSDLN